MKNKNYEKTFQLIDELIKYIKDNVEKTNYSQDMYILLNTLSDTVKELSDLLGAEIMASLDDVMED